MLAVRASGNRASVDRYERELTGLGSGVAFEEEQHARLWRRIEEIYTEQLPDLPLYFRSDSYVLPKWLINVVPTGHQYPTTLWVEDWRVQ